MARKHSKYIIIGAGLSGLTTAYQLLKEGEDDFIILEGSNQIGGRIQTTNGIDLGAVWFQHHHTNMLQLVDNLNLQKFEQYNKGKSVLVYNSMAPGHYFESNSNEPSAYRIAGGSIALINALAKKLQDKISINATVIGIYENKDQIEIQTKHKTYTAEKVIITLPPNLASTLTFKPTLPENLIIAMQQTHTWMSNAIKVGLTYKTPFWRDKDLSGTLISQISPVTELYDHSNNSETTFSLMGFVNEALRDESPENRKENILAYLEKYLGNEIRDYSTYHEKDWSLDSYISTKSLKSIYMSPQYGNPSFQNFYMNEKILFSGTETSQLNGGYMEGAIYSGLNAANLLLKNK